MKLIKINADHYIVVDETIQPVNGWYYDSFINKIRNTSGTEYGEAKHCWQITHSTQPYDNLSDEVFSMDYHNIKPLSLQEVKELIGEVDVEKKADLFEENYSDPNKSIIVSGARMTGYVYGYNQALEDNKDKKYTYYDIENAFNSGRGYGVPDNIKDFNSFIQSLQSKTEWEVEIVDGKLKLK